MTATDVRSSSTAAPSADFAALSEWYGFSDRYPAQTQSYFADHAGLTMLLRQLYPVVERSFGPAVRVTLELAHSPEEGCFGPLFALVAAQEPWQEAQVKLDAINADWLIEYPSSARHHILLDLEIG